MKTLERQTSFGRVGQTGKRRGSCPPFASPRDARPRPVPGYGAARDAACGAAWGCTMMRALPALRRLPDRRDRRDGVRVADVAVQPVAVLERPEQSVVVVGARVSARLDLRTDEEHRDVPTLAISIFRVEPVLPLRFVVRHDDEPIASER